MQINFATATPAQLAAAGFTFTAMTSCARRNHKSLFGVKRSANKKGCRKAPLAQAAQDFTGEIQG